MQQNILRRQALNKAYLRLKTSRPDMEAYKAALRTLLDSINPSESEEHEKNHLHDFLKAAFYEQYGVKTKGKTDLNYEAMHELVLYYLREWVEHKNHDLKYDVKLVDPGFAMPRAEYEMQDLITVKV